MISHAFLLIGACNLALSGVHALPSTGPIKPRLISESLKSGRASIPAVKITDPEQVNSRMTSSVDVASK